MRKFDNRIEPGTKVKLFGRKCWCTVKSVHPTRQWIELEELIGSFQRGNVERFSNKPKDRYE